jgi:hypothetical protein
MKNKEVTSWQDEKASERFAMICGCNNHRRLSATRPAKSEIRMDYRR